MSKRSRNRGVFYTYLWLREDGTPYYAGKGSWSRITEKHRWHGAAPPKHRIVYQDWPSEKDAFAAEKFLIAYYGRRDRGTGCLRNMTDGGEGSMGAKPSKEVIERRSAAHRGQGKHNFWLGKTMSEEHRRRMGDSRKGKSIATKGKPWSAARRAAHEKRVSIRVSY